MHTISKSKFNIRAMVSAAMLSAMAAVLMMFDFPLPFFPSFLKLDLSDLPALFGSFMFGPFVGSVIELIKNLVHLTRTQTGGVGELANFIIGAALVIPAGIVYKRRKTQGGALIGMGIGIALMAFAGALANYFILIPFYGNFMPMDSIINMCAAIIPAIDSIEKVVLLSIVPFNIFKGAIICLVTYFTYKRLSKLIKV